MTTHLNKWFILSLCCHALIFTVLFTRIHLHSTTPQYGNADETIIASYIVTTPQTFEMKNNPEMAAVKNAISIVHKTSKPPVHTTQKQRASVKGAPMPELIAFLHAAIQREQQYPASAQAMEREGRATLDFVLHPNGQISGLRLLRTSGTDALDRAALAAVNRAAPFAQVDRYLHESQEYQIDVVFKLD